MFNNSLALNLFMGWVEEEGGGREGGGKGEGGGGEAGMSAREKYGGESISMSILVWLCYYL